MKRKQDGRLVHTDVGGKGQTDRSVKTRWKWCIGEVSAKRVFNDGLWKELCGTTDEEVLERYKVDEAKTGGHRERGEPLDWRIVNKERRYHPRMWRGLLDKNLVMEKHAGMKDGRRGSQAARGNGSHGKNDEENEGEGQHGGSANCWLLASPRMRGHNAAMVQKAACKGEEG